MGTELNLLTAIITILPKYNHEKHPSLPTCNSCCLHYMFCVMENSVIRLTSVGHLSLGSQLS